MQQFQLPNPSQTSNRPTVSIPSPHPHPSSVHMRSAAMTAAMYADSACRPIRLVIPLSSEKACSAAVCASGRDSPHVSSYAPELACATACDRSRLQRACMRPCIRAPNRAYMHRASIYIYTHAHSIAAGKALAQGKRELASHARPRARHGRQLKRRIQLG